MALRQTYGELEPEEIAAWKKKLRKLILTIPSPQIDCLRYLIWFLSKVAKHEAKNKMHAKNLAIVFAPNILYSKTDDPQQAANDMTRTIETVALLIEEMDYF